MHKTRTTRQHAQLGGGYVKLAHPQQAPNNDEDTHDTEKTALWVGESPESTVVHPAAMKADIHSLDMA